MKSRIESTREARTEREEDVNVTMTFATRRSKLAMKLTRIAKFTIGEPVSVDKGSRESSGRRAVSSSIETRRDGGCDQVDIDHVDGR